VMQVRICAARGNPPTPVEGSWHDFPLVHACSQQGLGRGSLRDAAKSQVKSSHY
jgi:hypothetical protein